MGVQIDKVIEIAVPDEKIIYRDFRADEYARAAALLIM